jgi:hypothetical protein
MEDVIKFKNELKSADHVLQRNLFTTQANLTTFSRDLRNIVDSDFSKVDENIKNIAATLNRDICTIGETTRILGRNVYSLLLMSQISDEPGVKVMI